MSVDNYDNRVASLTEELVNERMESPRHVAEALDELAGTSDHNSDGNTHFAADLAAALMAGPGAREAYFATLEAKVRTYLARDASTDAEFRVSKGDDDAAEARDMARMGWAAAVAELIEAADNVFHNAPNGPYMERLAKALDFMTGEAS